MKKEDEWIKECDCLTINNKKIWFRCVWSFAKKAPNENKPSMQLVFNIYKEYEGWISWDDFKGSYIAEKLTDYVANTLNGQRTAHWDNGKKRAFNDLS